MIDNVILGVVTFSALICHTRFTHFILTLLDSIVHVRMRFRITFMENQVYATTPNTNDNRMPIHVAQQDDDPSNNNSVHR